MNSYSEDSVLFSEDVSAYELARDVVDLVDERMVAGDDLIRCHELARAVQEMLERHGFPGWEVADGKFGIVEHSWLFRRNRYVILDPYAVGRLPMVQLVAVSFKFELPYRVGSPRDDVRLDVLDRLREQIEDGILSRARCGHSPGGAR